MPYSTRSRFVRRPYASGMRNRATRGRSFTRRPNRRVLGGPAGYIRPSNSYLTLKRPYSDVVFLGSGAGTLAAANYVNPTNQIVFLTATSGDIPVGVATLANQAGFSCQWTLRDVVDIIPFTDLFNQFQLRRLTINFTLMNGTAYNASTANTVPSLAVCYDPNDAGLPADFETITTFENHKFHQFGEGPRQSFSYSIVPKAQGAFYKTALTNAYGTSNSPSSTWFDCQAGIDAAFYGFKGWFRNINTSVTCGLGVRMRVTADIVGRCIQ